MIEPSTDQTVQGSHDWRRAGNKAGFDHIVIWQNPLFRKEKRHIE
jgi:hypothetical protein